MLATSPLDRLTRAVRARDTLQTELANLRATLAIAAHERREMAQCGAREVITADLIAEGETAVREYEALLARVQAAIQATRTDLIAAAFPLGLSGLLGKGSSY